MVDEQALMSETDGTMGVPLQRVGFTDESFRDLLVASVDDSYRLAAVILADPREAEDAAHDAIERAWRSRSSLRDVTRFEAWFQRIVVNASRDRLRRRRSTPVAVSVERGADGGMSELLQARVADPFLASVQRQTLSHALSTLGADQQICLVLRFYLDLDIDEIARRTGTRSGTVKSRIHRGLNELRAAWDAAERDEREANR